jgi:DNA-binding transcriptional LysR family regulator
MWNMSVVANRQPECRILLFLMQQSLSAAEFDQFVAFIAVARCGSFTAAARELRRDGTVLSRRVAALERRLGVRVFDRTTRRIVLTEVGHALLADVEPALMQLMEAGPIAGAKALKPHGVLRVALPASFGRLWIAPRLPEFIERHPDLVLDLSFSNRFVDVVAERFDVAVRIGAMDDSSLVASRIANHRRVLVASPGYLQQRGIPRHPVDIQGHLGLLFSGFRSHPAWVFVRGAERVDVKANVKIVSDDADGMLAAAVSGHGLLLCAEWLVARECAAGSLEEVLGDWDVEDQGAIAVLHPSRVLVPAKTRVFVDWMKTLFGNPTPWTLPRLRS